MPREVKWAISFGAGALLLWIGWNVYTFLVVLHVLICLVLIGVILLQSGKAADIAGAFGGAGSQTAFGPRGAATFLSRATTWCAVMFMATSFSLTVHARSTIGAAGNSVLEQFSQSPTAPANPVEPAAPGAPAVPPPTAPSVPAPAPETAPEPAAPDSTPAPTQ